MAAEFTNGQLVACARREVKMREGSYPRWESKASIAECSEKRQLEYKMMQAITDQLTALPELLARYQRVKDELALAYKGAEQFNDELQKYMRAYGPLQS